MIHVLRFTTVKKVKLRTTQSDSKIFREVNALSRLSHRFIVRYYTTWVETSEPESTAASSGSVSETEVTDDGTEEADGMTSVPASSTSNSTEEIHQPGFNGRFSIDLDDLDDMGGSGTQSSFPSIHFDGSASSSEKASDSSDSTENSGGPFGNLFSTRASSSDPVERTKDRPKTPPLVARTLYIQMVGCVMSKLSFYPNCFVGICRATDSKGGMAINCGRTVSFLICDFAVLES